MENIIRDMICAAWRHNDYEMATQAYKIMSEFAGTFNCPSNWRTIGMEMAREYSGTDLMSVWITENCCLTEFSDE